MPLRVAFPATDVANWQRLAQSKIGGTWRFDRTVTVVRFSRPPRSRERLLARGLL
jgi:hypothetical protein